MDKEKGREQKSDVVSLFYCAVYLTQKGYYGTNYSTDYLGMLVDTLE